MTWRDTRLVFRDAYVYAFVQTRVYSNLPEDYGISAGDRYVFGRLDRLEMETADKWCI